MKRIHGTAAGLLLALPVSMPASGARFPDAVETAVALTGAAAHSVAELFGLSLTAPAAVALPLGPNDAWAVYLLKQDTPRRLWNANEGVPARHNALRYTSAPTPSLHISPYWLDLGTRLPEPKPGGYSFGSPLLLDAPDPDDPWIRLLRRLRKEPGWHEGATPTLQRCFPSAEGTELCLTVSSAKDYADHAERRGYRIYIEARSNRPE